MGNENGYAPKALIFDALKAADRPMTYKQLARGLNGVPIGTVNGSLSEMVNKLKIIEVVGRADDGSALYRTTGKDLPAKYRVGRISKPMEPGRHSSKKKSKAADMAMLFVIPVGKKETVTVDEDWARRIYEKLHAIFGAK